MTETLQLRGARVFDGDRLADDSAVTLAGGRVVAVGAPAAADTVVELAGGILAPGFVDLQVNGGGGVLFNNAPTTASLATMAAAHRRGGTTALMPTVITDARDVQLAGMRAVRESLAAGVPGVLGIHLEGPHLDAARRGVHRASFLRAPDAADVEAIVELAASAPVIVTLAPEHVSPDVVKKLAESGVRVCAGHSDADYATVRNAASHGLGGFTHLYNAMRPFAAREPGVVGAALDLDECACGIIADGHHASPAAIRLAYRAKPAGKLFLVSDAMATAGSDLRTYELYGQLVEEVDGCLRDPEGRIAGSSIMLIDAVRIAHQDVGLPLEECLRMASLYPAAFIGDERRGRLQAGYQADLVHFDDAFNVLATWTGGRFERY